LVFNLKKKTLGKNFGVAKAKAKAGSISTKDKKVQDPPNLRVKKKPKKKMQVPLQVDFTPDDSHLLLSFAAPFEKLAETVKNVMSDKLATIETQLTRCEPNLRLNRYGVEMSVTHNVVFLTIPMLRVDSPGIDQV
jgi:hypothetical protein